MAVPADELANDRALVLAVQSGDLEAFTELFRRHYPAVKQACTRRLPCPLEADDIAQAAFVRALERIHLCSGERQFGGWVHTIARNLCVDSLRASSRVVPTETPAFEERTDGLEPPDSLIDRERQAHVRLALDSLPPRQRQAVTARALGSRPGEIANDLGLSVGAVDSLILRGRRRLARAYRRAAGEGGATRTRIAANASAAASVAAVFSLGSSRLMAGVAAAAEAGRDLVAPAVAGVAAAVVSAAAVVTGSGPMTDVPPSTAKRPPAVVVPAPLPDAGPTAASGGGLPGRGVPSAGQPSEGPGAGSSQPASSFGPGGSLAPGAGASSAGPGAGAQLVPAGTGTSSAAPPTAGLPPASGATGGSSPGSGGSGDPGPAPPEGGGGPVSGTVTGTVDDVEDVDDVDDVAGGVVGTVGDTADDAVDSVTGLLPG